MSKLGFAGDFENWDGRCVTGEVLFKVLDIINAWYNDGPENAMVRRVLIEEAVHTVTVCGNLVYVKHQGLPSGFPLTADINSIVNWIYLGYCWRRIMRVHKKEWIHMEWFKQLVRAIVYGDDNVVAVHPKALEFYNHTSVSEEFQRIGINYTMADKGAASIPWQPIRELSFLKRGFVSHPRFPKCIMAPIERDTIHEKLNWIRKCPDPIEAIRSNAIDALREAYFVGESYFQNLKKGINTAFQESGLAGLAHTYADFDEDWLKQFYD
jgi:hypothetical protein